MKCLDLFSGTHSVAKVVKEMGHEVVTLDLKDADININILDWDYTIYPPNYFDYIHASPPCDTFSSCRKSYYGLPLKAHNPDWKNDRSVIFSPEIFLNDQLTIGVPILNKTLEIIDYFKPKYFTIENPKNGDMKKHIKDISFSDITYCKYGFAYKKPTRIWNNFNFKGQECTANELCDNIFNNRHLQSCGNKETRRRNKHITNIEGIKGGGNNKTERYRIPPLLIKDFLSQMN